MAAEPGWLDALNLVVGASDASDIAIFIGVLAVGAAVSGWRAHRYLNHYRTVEDIPTSRARSAHQGYVELEGVGRDLINPPLNAPLSGLPCLWYRYKIEEEITTTDGGGGAKKRWKTIDKGESQVNFWLEDNTGRIQIDPDGAEITPRHKDQWKTHSGMRHASMLTPDVVNFLHARASTNPHRFTEERIIAADPLYAIGLLRNLRSHNSGPSVRDVTLDLLHQWKTDQATLKDRFDLDKDGKIDQQEWMLARAQARREVLAARQTQEDFSEGTNVLTDSGDPRRPYLVSAFRQSDLVKRYRNWTVLYATGFFAGGSVALWLFNVRFG